MDTYISHAIMHNLLDGRIDTIGMIVKDFLTMALQHVTSYSLHTFCRENGALSKIKIRFLESFPLGYMKYWNITLFFALLFINHYLCPRSVRVLSVRQPVWRHKQLIIHKIKLMELPKRLIIPYSDWLKKRQVHHKWFRPTFPGEYDVPVDDKTKTAIRISQQQHY